MVCDRVLIMTTLPEVMQCDGSLTVEELRHKIIALEQLMLASGESQGAEAFETNHYFTDGLYAREILIPAGTLLTGKIHRFGHINIISKGDISVMTENGIKRIKSPCTLISKPGIKRVGFAHEDTIWTTIHATTETTVEAAENVLVHNDYIELEEEV